MQGTHFGSGLQLLAHALHSHTARGILSNSVATVTEPPNPMRDDALSLLSVYFLSSHLYDISKHFTFICAKSFTKTYKRKHKATLQQNLIMKFSQNN
jgi:hypothetical protein